MTERICVGCGWVYPPSFNERRCRFCGTVFAKRICPYCGELKVSYTTDSPICRDCYNEREREIDAGARSRRWRNKRIAAAESKYAEWLKQITAAPFNILTEEQWLQACRYFGGCALCDITEIAARGYFIQFKYGGRYTAWNVIPVCELCATGLNKQPNPFKRFDTILNDSAPAYRGVGNTKLKIVAEYLQERLDEYAK